MLLHIPSLIVTFIYGCHALKSSFQRTHWTLKWPCHKIEFKAYSKPFLTSQPNRKAEEEEATHQCKNEEINWGEKSSSSIYPNSHLILIFILRSPWLSDDLLTDFLANFGGSWRSIFFPDEFSCLKKRGWVVHSNTCRCIRLGQKWKFSPLSSPDAIFFCNSLDYLF